MKLRWWTILWTVAGMAAAGVVCFWVLIHFNLLPVRNEIFMDLYTGKLRLHSSCAGLTLKVEPCGNFSSGLVPGGNLATYDDPEGREEWVKVADSSGMIKGPLAVNSISTKITFDCYSALNAIALAISNDPRPGFKYDPPNGYTVNCKRQLLLNSLRVARESRDAQTTMNYYHRTVNTLRPLNHKANAEELPDVVEFLAEYDVISDDQ